MESQILVAVITGGLSLLGVIITTRQSGQKILNEMDKHLSIQHERLETLRKEVEKHNNFAERVPLMEIQLKHLTDQLVEAKCELNNIKEKGAS